MFSIADEKIPEDSGFIQITQANHIFYPMDRGGVHWFDVGGILGGNPVFLKYKEKYKDTTPNPQQTRELLLARMF